MYYTLRTIAISLVILIASSIFSLTLNAQDAEPQYLSNVLITTDKKNASYFRNADGKQGDHFVGKTYSIEGVLKVEGVYADKQLSIEDGHFTFYYPNGKIESRGDYEMGLKSGIWERFDMNGNELAEKIYDAKALENIVYTMAQTMPKYKGGDEKVFKHYIKSTVANSIRTKLKGGVTTSFIVEKDGALSDIRVIGNEDKIVQAKVIEAVQASSPWDAGVEKGRLVRVQLEVPVKF
ncbi:MAG: energy transducer TonB [Flavobacteriales bacterium]|nr:energy transducer TonB [Flavobacteriales bacterium]